MSFTYFIDRDDPQERDYVRFQIQDTIEDSGPLPLDTNFADHEIDAMINVEGSWQRAVAACYEALAAAWIVNPSWTADGYSVSQSHIGKNFSELATEWRKKYGGTTGKTAHARSVTRVDGYSQDVPSDEVT